MKKIAYAAAGILLSFALMVSCGKTVELNPSVTQTETGLECIGVIAPKTLAEVHNDLTVGCEVLDRDYADYHKYKEYLEALGIRKIRLQAGWAKTEKVKGELDFAWLDSIIDDAVSRGMEPWVETSYGNPIYEGGGTKYLAGGWPTSEEALAAWDRWVEAMAVRYKGKVHEWEVWNEPDINKVQFKDTLGLIDLQVRTAEIIKKVDPDAKIAAFAWAAFREKYFERCMQLLKEQGKLDLFEWISYHFYSLRPEGMYKNVEKMQAILDKYSDRIILRQGETGAPSKGNYGGAMSNYDWTEISQSKWALRRMLSDKGKNIPTTIFSISDINYFKDKDLISKKNVKGLLETDDDNNILRCKEAYYGVQNLASLWDCMDKPIPSDNISIETDGSRSLYEFQNTGNGNVSFVVWDDAEAPDNTVKTEFEKVTVKGGSFKNPVCVDIRTGNVYKLDYSKQGGDWVFSVPVYDSPVLVIDRKLLKLK